VTFILRIVERVFDAPALGCIEILLPCSCVSFLAFGNALRLLLGIVNVEVAHHHPLDAPVQ
jgi:hypothetical protein